MTKTDFDRRVKSVHDEYQALLSRPNEKITPGNGIYDRYLYPVLTADHAPLTWRYDFDYKTNPHFMTRMGINSAFNAGAIEHEGKYCVMARVEGWDRKSFFGLAMSPNGVDRFEFTDYPIVIPEIDPAETNIYDMRLVKHEDGRFYGLFCSERHDEEQPHNLSAAVASCGIVRSQNLIDWERLPNLKSQARQQRNCVLHPEFVNGKYAFYTRPLRDFAATGSGEGIGWALCDSIESPEIGEEAIIDPRAYHTIKEGKNGLGPAPIKTEKGWLHLAHGVRDTAAGMRYVLYLLLADLNDPSRIIKQPGGYFLAPQGEESIGDVSNVAFSNGWIADAKGDVYIYYGGSDTRLYVVTSTIEKLLDYTLNTPEDGGRTYVCVQQRRALVEKNLTLLKSK